MRCLDWEACPLQVLLEDLHQPCVCQDAPVHHEQQLPMQVDAPTVHLFMTEPCCWLSCRDA